MDIQHQLVRIPKNFKLGLVQISLFWQIWTRFLYFSKSGLVQNQIFFKSGNIMFYERESVSPPPLVMQTLPIQPARSYSPSKLKVFCPLCLINVKKYVSQIQNKIRKWKFARYLAMPHPTNPLGCF